MDSGPGGNVVPMMSRTVCASLALVTSAVVSGSACVMSQDSLGDGSTAGTGGGDVDDPTATNGMSSTNGNSSATASGSGIATDATTTEDDGASDCMPKLDVGGVSGGCAATEDDGAADGMSSLDVSGLPGECTAIDHDTCFSAAVEACYGDGDWDEDQECIDAVQGCYPFGTTLIDPAVLIEACHDETAGCTSENSPGCGETFCECTVGAYPYDWNNCWHLVLLACDPDGGINCDGVLAECYPDATVPQAEQCRAQVIDDNNECSCPMCGVHEQCEDAVAECLGA